MYDRFKGANLYKDNTYDFQWQSRKKAYSLCCRCAYYILYIIKSIYVFYIYKFF